MQPQQRKRRLTHQKGSAKRLILWYNIIAKNIKPTKELYHKVDEITKGELLSNKITRLNSTELQEPLELLEELNYIKIVEERTKRAVKPKTIIKVNPIIFYE